MKKLKFDWLKIIVFAVFIGIYAGITTLVPAFRDTSFLDISISFEWWIFFGILIILGSNSNKDAALKCFVFFLISQPLVYLTQIVAGSASWEIFDYYKYWFIWTILTLPMGYVGYFLKKDKWWGLFIIAPIWLLLGWHINMFLGEVIGFFPNHLLSLIFCLVVLFGSVFYIFSHRLERILGSIICTIITLACLLLNINQPKSYSTTILCSNNETPFDNSYVVEMDEQYGKLEIFEKDFETSKGYCVNANFTKLGTTQIIIKNTDKEYRFNLTIGRNTYSIEEMK